MREEILNPGLLTFRQFLNESTKIPPKVSLLEVEEAINFLNKHCRNGLNAVKNGNVLFRGSDPRNLHRKTIPKLKPGKAETSMYLVDSSEMLRTSKDTNNVYQLMMDASLSLRSAGVPERSKSFCCHTDRDEADEYIEDGVIYAVIPVDGTNIAVSEENDFLDQGLRLGNRWSKLFPNHANSGLVDFSKNMGNFLKKVGVNVSQNTKIQEIDRLLSSEDALELACALVFDLNYLAIKKYSPSDKSLKDYSDQKSIKIAGQKITPRDLQRRVLEKYGKDFPIGAMDLLSLISDLFEKFPNERFTRLSSELMTPKSLCIKVAKSGEKFHAISTECWVSGECVFIGEEMFGMIIRALKRQGYPVHQRYTKMYD